MSTTYAPSNVIDQPDVFEWSDYGGRYLNIRRRDSGELQVTTHAPDKSGLSIERADKWPTTTFAVSTRDAPGFMSALMYWCRAATRCPVTCYAGPGHQSKFQCELPASELWPDEFDPPHGRRRR